MKLLDIGEVVERTGTSPSTLRYYEDIALISSAGRKGLRRQYEPDVLLQLALIALSKSAGFSLEEIAAMFGGKARPELPRAQLRHQAEKIDAQIRRLGELRDTLQHVAECPAPSHLECKSFRRLLTASLKAGSKLA